LKVQRSTYTAENPEKIIESDDYHLALRWSSVTEGDSSETDATYHDDIPVLVKLLFEIIGVHGDIEHVYRIASLSKPSANNISTVGWLRDRDGADGTLKKVAPTESTRERTKPSGGEHALRRGLDAGARDRGRV
jgi:hypothetical protein